MLHLKRKTGQEIFINDIKIRVLEINSTSVTLGFDSPPQTLILRGEQYNDIKCENTKASGILANDLVAIRNFVKKEDM